MSVTGEKKRILMICMGNICRSPTAEGVLRHLVEQHGLSSLIEVESAGTHGYHVGESPDRRAQQAALKRGYDLSALRARKVTREDFEKFDLVLAMDRENLANLLEICPPSERLKVRLFLSYAEDADVDEVPDPYYGGPAGFERVLDLVERAAQGVIKVVR